MKKASAESRTKALIMVVSKISVISHSLNGYKKPLKRPFDQYQSHLEAISKLELSQLLFINV